MKKTTSLGVINDTVNELFQEYSRDPLKTFDVFNIRVPKGVKIPDCTGCRFHYVHRKVTPDTRHTSSIKHPRVFF